MSTPRQFYVWFLLSRGDKADAVKWNALKGHLGTARKPEQLTTIGRQLAYFLYLSLDAVTWAHSIKFTTLQTETAAKVARIANRAWLAGILLSIANAAIRTSRLTRESKALRSKSSEKDVGVDADRQTRLQSIATTRAAIRHQFIIDALDLWIPASALGLSNVNDGVVGICGVISSLMALEKLSSKRLPHILVEALTGDFGGVLKDAGIVAQSGLDVFAHNVETTEELTPFVRDRRATFRRSLAILEHAKSVGVDQVLRALKELRKAQVDVVTFGQYMRPTKRHMKVDRYVEPAEFDRWKAIAEDMGFLYVASGPLVRSSYKAGEFFIENVLRGKRKAMATPAVEQLAVEANLSSHVTPV
ncbi:Lipoyl synthase, mitochondrial [Mycena kentingensis (nom. inval.)]|nr:Lipoyl synthase, mitochondrial [Mycena kentingensis (nom. inval.)]